MSVSFSLHESQINAFHRNGYAVIERVISDATIERLRMLFDSILASTDPISGIAVQETAERRYITTINNIFNTGNHEALELLADPGVLGIAEALCGEGCVPVQDFAVIKHRGDGNRVEWHQDMMHDRSGAGVQMGIYLDDVEVGDGALRVVPGSQGSGEDICSLRHLPYEEIPMRSGGILVHDMMVAHSSEPLRQTLLRRVIYIEFLSRALSERLYGAEVTELRTELISIATAPLNTASRESLRKIYARPFNVQPSTYCLEGIIG